jgi:hypothetical protein
MASGSGIYLVAAVLGMSHNPVAYVTLNASSIIEGNLDNSSDLSMSPMTICTSKGSGTAAHTTPVLVLSNEQQCQ